MKFVPIVAADQPVHDVARRHRDRDHAAGPAQGLQLRHLSDGRKRRRSGALLDRAGAPRHPAARRRPRPAPPCPHRAHHARSTFSIDTDFDGVIDGCAASRPGRRSTWINARIRALYRELFELGHCHTVEVWNGGKLVGGLYGVALGGAFFGESMFSYERDASKVALVHLVARLIAGGFTLLDTQFVTDHLRQFGTVEVDRDDFQRRLDQALKVNGDFNLLPRNAAPEDVLAILKADA